MRPVKIAIMRFPTWVLVLGLNLAGGLIPAVAWDYPGHRMVNQLALAALPADFPAFARTPANAARIAFLAGEPDRWRSTNSLPLKHANGMNHYLDLEQLRMAGLDPATVPALRYQFALEFAAGRAAHAAAFAVIDRDEGKNEDHSREWPGFLPWQIAEDYGRLESEFSYLMTFERYGTPEEVAEAQANIVQTMGVMGHYVGDGSQPLHATIHHHGWVGPNPHRYSRWLGLHRWIDGGFIAAAGIKVGDMLPRVTPAQPLDLAAGPSGRDPVFSAAMAYVEADNREVEPLYQLDQAGQFRKENIAQDVQGRAFIEQRLLAGGEMLARLWVTAWRNAKPDGYLQAELLKRSKAEIAAP